MIFMKKKKPVLVPFQKGDCKVVINTKDYTAKPSTTRETKGNTLLKNFSTYLRFIKWKNRHNLIRQYWFFLKRGFNYIK